MASIGRLLRLQVSLAECSLFYRALLQQRPMILRNLLIEATPYLTTHTHTPRKRERRKKRKTKRGRVDGREEEKERWREGRGGGVGKNPRSIARATVGGGERYYDISLHTRTHRERVGEKKRKAERERRRQRKGKMAGMEMGRVRGRGEGGVRKDMSFLRGKGGRGGEKEDPRNCERNVWEQ